MTKINELLLEVQHVKAFLEAAEAALSGSGKPSSKVEAASVGIEGARDGLAGLIKLLAEAKAEHPMPEGYHEHLETLKQEAGIRSKGPSLADIEAANKRRGEADAAASAAGKTAN
ncbi:hypothetical protein AB3G45_13845 [Shinella sp. S4-D37]|uniref:hypothetical protein n=1 Tax=Shinella sp. S4-D37 TaxID=3161999 RepID=UPI00346648A2